jgi:hypothetical protein
MADSAQYVTPTQDWVDWDPNNPYTGNITPFDPTVTYTDDLQGADAAKAIANWQNNWTGPFDPASAQYGQQIANGVAVQNIPGFSPSNPGGAYGGFTSSDYNAGLQGLSNTIARQTAGYTQSMMPYTQGATDNYYNGIGARQGIIDNQQNALNQFSNADAGIYGAFGNTLTGLTQQGNDAISGMSSAFHQSAGLDASNVSGLGSSLGNANYLDTQNMAELGSALGQSNALGAQSLGQLQSLNGSMRQLTAQGYGADVASDPQDVARQEAAYGAFGDFANGAYDYTSQAAQAYADPESIAAQKSALGQLKEQSTPKLTDAERYLYMQARLQQEQSNRANRDANLRELQRSGMSGSTMALSNLNASSQEANNTRALSDLGANAEAIKRASAALVNYGNLASTISGQSFQQAYGRGQAADTASQFNTNTKLQGTIGQGNMATQMRSADDALAEFNKAQSLQQQRFVDQYAADQQNAAWGRGVDVSNAGFNQANLVGRNAAVKSNAGFQQTQNLSNNAKTLSDAQFTQSGDLSRNATNLGNAQLTNVGQQRNSASDLARTGAQMNSDWLTGTQNLGNQQLTGLRDNTSALGAMGDALYRQTGIQQTGDTQRNALTQKSLDNQMEDTRAAQAEQAAKEAAVNAIPGHEFGLGESVDANGHIIKRGLAGGYIIPGIL